MKVGDYVRYKNFSYDDVVYIGKITDCKIGYEIDGRMTSAIKLMKEPSPNIIDLIEVEDYVNGERVTQVTNDYIEVCYGRDSTDFIKEKNIKSIVTKEQFLQMEYRIGE